jgi:hypothetical protein
VEIIDISRRIDRDGQAEACSFFDNLENMWPQERFTARERNVFGSHVSRVTQNAQALIACYFQGV